jgi:uncharacterized protein (DUF362 family)
VNAPLADRRRVAVVGCADYDPSRVRAALDEGLALLGGPETFAAAGDRILVKPNLFAAMRPERAQTTHPALVRALCDVVAASGAVAEVGDNPVFGFAGLTYRVTGIAAALRGSGARLVDLRQTVPRAFPDGRRATRFLLPERLAGYRRVLSVAKLKTHTLMGLTGAVKNAYGLVHGRGARKVLHLRHADPDAFAEMLLDLDAAVRPALYVVDAIVAADGNGPRHGRPRPVGAIVLGTDGTAVDFVLARMVGFPATEVVTLRVALRRPEWSDPDARIEIVGTASGGLPRVEFLPATPGGIVRALPGPLRDALLRRSRRAEHDA